MRDDQAMPTEPDPSDGIGSSTASGRGSSSPATVITQLRAAGCVFAEDEAALLIQAAADADELAELVARRVAGAPLEHLLGWVEFCGLRVALSGEVFVPRQRTAVLVAEAIRLAAVDRSTRPPHVPVVVDLCCGSGAVGLAVATALGRVRLHAADLDPAAVRCAASNLEPVGGLTYQGDLFEPLPERLHASVDLLVVNAPYVPTDSIPLLPPEARDHEPRLALDGGPDGLDLHRRIAAEAGRWLTEDGHLLIETSDRQRAGTAAALTAAGLTVRVVEDPEVNATVVVGRRPAPTDRPRH
jgi:release factor glutamine methyltransferase